MRKTKKKLTKVFKKLIEYFGSQQKIADALKIKQPSVYRWFLVERIPIKRAIQIQKITKGQITLQELRPDLFK